MAERDYVSEPIADSLGLRAIIQGLAADLRQMRDGAISPSEGTARAAVAKQIFNGVRLHIQAVKMLESRAKVVHAKTQIETNPAKESHRDGS